MTGPECSVCAEIGGPHGVPAAPDTTGGELREALVSRIFREQEGRRPLLTAPIIKHVLDSNALRDLIAERDKLAAQVRAVEELHRMVPIKGRDWSICSVDGDEWPCDTRRALGNE